MSPEAGQPSRPGCGPRRGAWPWGLRGRVCCLPGASAAAGRPEQRRPRGRNRSLAGNSTRRDPPFRPRHTHPQLLAREASSAGARPRTAPPFPPAPGTDTSTGASGGPEALGPEVTSRRRALREAGSRLRAGPGKERRKPVARRRTRGTEESARGGGRALLCRTRPRPEGRLRRPERNPEADELEVTRGVPPAEAIGWLSWKRVLERGDWFFHLADLPP